MVRKRRKIDGFEQHFDDELAKMVDLMAHSDVHQYFETVKLPMNLLLYHRRFRFVKLVVMTVAWWYR